MIKILDKLWRFLASLKTGIALIALIALTNLLGSFVLQRDQVPPGQIEKTYSPEAIRIMEGMGLFDLYHSWWFIGLLILTGISLIIASIDIWPRFWGRANEKMGRMPATEFFLQPLKASIRGSKQSLEKQSENIKPVLKSFLRGSLKQESYEGHVAFWGQKGRWSNLSVFVIHLGLLLILVGGFIGTRWGFEGLLRLREGQSTHFFFDERGQGEARPLGFTIRCNDVRMEKYPDGSPKAYYSDLDIIKEGQVVKSKTIRVNDPLGYEGIYFYQAQYGTEAGEPSITLRMRVEDNKTGAIKAVAAEPGQTVPFEVAKKKGSFKVLDYSPNFGLPMEGKTRALGPAVRIEMVDGAKDENFWIFKNLPEFDKEVRKGGLSFYLDAVTEDQSVREFTGLAVGSNPGISTVWLGSLILLAGIMWNILGAHRKFWVLITDEEILVAARSNRQKERITRRFEKLVEALAEKVEGHT